jgi:hypothetical protein
MEEKKVPWKRKKVPWKRKKFHGRGKVPWRDRILRNRRTVRI